MPAARGAGSAGGGEHCTAAQMLCSSSSRARGGYAVYTQSARGSSDCCPPHIRRTDKSRLVVGIRRREGLFDAAIPRVVGLHPVVTSLPVARLPVLHLVAFACRVLTMLRRTEWIKVTVPSFQRCGGRGAEERGSLTGLTWSYIGMVDFSEPGTTKLAVHGSRTSPSGGSRSSI